MLRVKQQQGMSLVEMLVSLVAGLVVVAGGVALFSAVIVSGTTTLMLSRLNQEVQAVIDMIARDIQRAGYHPGAALEMADEVSPALSVARKYIFSTTADLYTAAGDTRPSCIRVKYWDPEPASGFGSIVRTYGYSSSGKLLRVNTLYTEPAGAALASADCSTGAQLVASPEVVIDNLEFELVSSGNPSGVRAVNIRLSATHARNPKLSLSLERRVKIRNDDY
ncbi:PilW family protein [Zobellella iuensis]|uniref:Prepilin-type N-terminal cleavage/methylation domain-containing protein n=1 Tax=Zobellella iuensis TaxID=2803811 RepID=A0ABS1QRV0_9GAMM|nr:prepilin-type N-terminal cleavage/methylation domain-containing protein [Zobellella iuensis]MBL1376848.1 prepilin-type N-terminal cleavage/methylation domain-containing protein [Zobellella iuensis]